MQFSLLHLHSVMHVTKTKRMQMKQPVLNHLLDEVENVFCYGIDLIFLPLQHKLSGTTCEYTRKTKLLITKRLQIFIAELSVLPLRFSTFPKRGLMLAESHL